jgi:hypothetical protein
MLEAQHIIESKRGAARELDQRLVYKRRSAVCRSLAIIEGQNHSEKYVSRLAGESSDVYRKSRSEQFLEWFGATCLKSPEHSMLCSEFWTPLFNYATGRLFYGVRDFFDIDSDINDLFSRVRKSYVHANLMEARFLLCQIRSKIDEMLMVINAMDGVKA